MVLVGLFIGTAVATGLLGAGKTAKAAVDNSKANKINTIANKNVEEAKNRLVFQREEVSESLNSLGEIKLNILGDSVADFVQTFEKLKNVDFRSSVGLEELKNLHIDQKDFEELKKLSNFAIEVAGGATAGVAGGALTAMGAWGAASTFAFASTGTAISTLSGAAAGNATLAFFGGGAVSAGGMGIAGGAAILGGLIAGPALLVMGLITGSKMDEKLDKALANKAQSEEIVEAFDTASFQCSAIRRRTYMFYNLLSHLDAYFLPLVWKMEDIVNKEGVDYSMFSEDSKKTVMEAAASACSIKAIIDTPILTQDGILTEASEKITQEIGRLIYMKDESQLSQKGVAAKEKV